MPRLKNPKLSASREISLKTKSEKKTDLTVVSKKSRLSKKDQEDVKSFFGPQSKKVLDLLETGDADSGLALLKKTLLITVIRVLPASEKVLTESGNSRGVYQFNQLISQIRELITDIQADRDKKYIAQSVMETIIRPVFMDIAQDMITKHHEFRKATERYVKQEQSQQFSSDLRDLAKDLAGGMNEKYKDISAKMIEALKN